MAFLTPGIVFLSRALLTLALPLTVILGVRIVLADTLNITIPIPALLAGFSVLLPIALSVRHGLSLMSEKRRAAKMGARIAPKVVGKWPGNLDKLIQIVKNVRYGYPGESLN